MLASTGVGLMAYKNTVNQTPSKAAVIPKTDTHVHFFDLDNFSYPWLKNAPEINRNFGIADFQEASKSSHIGKMVFVESGAKAGLGVKEANWVRNLANEEPRIKGIIAKLQLNQGRETAQTLERLREVELLKGVRDSFPKNAHESSSFLNGLGLLAVQDLTFDLLLSTPHLASAAIVAQKCPQNVFILDHLGNPNIQAGNAEQWKKGIQQLAALPNVHCKLSGIITRIGKDWTQDKIEPYILYVIEQFGVDRLMYGGDWPVVLRADSYHSWARGFERITEKLSASDLHKIYHLNADRIYRLL